MEKLQTIRYDVSKNTICILDQTRLPNELKEKILSSAEDVYHSIKFLEVRGAPLIGITAAYGLAMVAQQLKFKDMTSFIKGILETKEYYESARPTAVNLENALNKMVEGLESCPSIIEAKKVLLDRAVQFHENDRWIGQQIGHYGNLLLGDKAQVMTYCNAGSLATGNRYGTALAPIYTAQECGKQISVYACETRPILQGARLTSFELTYNHIPTTLITDNMMGWLMSSRHIDAIFVGCDRVATNGDFANKIGTYTLAVLAEKHHVPFYVCTPSTTIDFSAKSAEDIEIEFRDPEEVRSMWYCQPMASQEATILNPAFDRTPAALVTGYITEKGILLPSFSKESF
ncbi:MAG: S-methyl-5-thioribose-1-phosphate isomerase [Peptococcaceae bacterium]|nr:S-methyl-5-thioribose-1-phosphate isomerase [Peptococcaceae bacterium]